MKLIQIFLSETAFNKVKVSVLASSITALICNGVNASDIDIYSAPTTSGSTTTLMMMLDVSGSMRVTHPTPSVAMDACDFANPRSYYDYKIIPGEAEIGGVKLTYDRFNCRTSNNKENYLYRSTDEWNGWSWVTKWRSCKTASCGGNNSGSTNLNAAPDVTDLGIYQSDNVSYYYRLSGVPSETKFDRITRLKDAMVLLLLGGKDSNNNDVKKLDDKIILGLSTLGAVNGTSTRNAGTIVVPARRLDANVTVGGRTIKQRQLILEKILAINPISGTPTANSYAETAAYLLGKSTSGLTNTGFDWSDSSTDTRTSTGYTQPASIKSQVSLADDAKSCHAQGIYVLTDGEPNDLGDKNATTGTRGLVQAALDNSSFSCDGTKEGWDCIFKLNENLADKTKNKSKVDILTAVIGFGKGFTVIPNTAQTESEIDTYTSISQNVRNTAKWGIKGNGGWYSGESTDDIVESFSKFLGKVRTNIPGVSTGTATIPVDALNSSTIQPFGYFPQFVPKVAPTDLQQTWYGNLKKYHAVNGSLYGTKSGTQPVMQNDEIKNVVDKWNNSSFANDSNEIAFRYGALSQIIRGYNANTEPKERLILSDFVYKDKTETKSLNLSQYDTTDEKKPVAVYQAISTSYNLDANAPYREALMNLLGYENAQAGVNLQNLATDAISKQVPQIGAILHSKPILLTQEGKPTVTKGTDGKVLIDTTNRKDYILFGSTQGLLHVLDARTGKEKFAFLPYEMIKKQQEAFKHDGGSTTGGKSNLYYGIDGEWTAHTTYVSKSDGTLSVDGGTRTIVNDENKEEINLKGKQWVYGGLRMGGRSYYALDLTDLDVPKVKFHIDPENSKVHYLDNNVTKERTITELSKMGQSWSKPTLAYVNWKGSRKLVMIVGGGYDAGYESPTYDQDSAEEKKIGAGVYMFDADNGNLLWSVSGNYDSSTTGDRNLKLAGDTIGMDYSIVSSIKTVDRNNDGLIDHLYFGDLRGQAFRVDFNPSKTEFESQVTKILDLKFSKRRFYEQPTFTIHSQGVAAVSFASGDRSNPMNGKTTSADASLNYDGVFVIYDYDVYSNKYPSTNIAARSLGTTALGGHTQLRLLEKRVDLATASTKKPVINSSADKGDGGWYYLLNKEENLLKTDDKAKQILKSFAPLIAIENDLYVPVFDASKSGTTGSCSAGVAGETSLHRFCLPYGVCKENIFIALGAGIGEPIMGGGRDGDNNQRSIFILNEDKKGGGGGGSSMPLQIINYGGALKFIPNRWYEQYAQGGG